MKFIAIEHKPTKALMPQTSYKRPTSIEPEEWKDFPLPRLWVREADAKNVLRHYLRGKATSFPHSGEIFYKGEPRQSEDFHFITVTLTKETPDE